MIKRTIILILVIFMAVIIPYFIGQSIIRIVDNKSSGVVIEWICGAFSLCIGFIVFMVIYCFIQSCINYIKTGIFN